MKRRRHHNHRLVKIHRSYTAEEIARLFGIHKNTVRHWVKEGLATIDDKRPILILGYVLAAFLQARRTKNKQTCKPGNSIACAVALRDCRQEVWRTTTPSLRNSVISLPFARTAMS